jgi:hypothetical protein
VHDALKSHLPARWTIENNAGLHVLAPDGLRVATLCIDADGRLLAVDAVAGLSRSMSAEQAATFAMNRFAAEPACVAHEQADEKARERCAAAGVPVEVTEAELRSLRS